MPAPITNPGPEKIICRCAYHIADLLHGTTHSVSGILRSETDRALYRYTFISLIYIYWFICFPGFVFEEAHDKRFAGLVRHQRESRVL